MRLADAMERGRDNNFNLLRLVAALTVLAYHSVLETRGYDHFANWKEFGTTPGGLAVDVFFVTSGLLVSRSLLTSKSVLTFTRARLLRIFPGLLVCVMFTGLVIGPIYSTYPVADYFGHVPALARYIIGNLQPFVLPHPIDALPGTAINNGPLWSIPVELCCYTMLSSVWLALSIARTSWTRWIVLVPASIAFAWAAWRFSQTAGFRLAWMFGTGVAFYLLRDRIRVSGWLLAAALCACLVALVEPRLIRPLLLISLPYIVVCAAYLPAGRIRNFNRVGDYSYGVYIYSLPLQYVVRHEVPGVGAVGLTFLALPLALLAAMLSWHLVEKRALAWRHSPVLRSRALAGIEGGSGSA